MNKIGWGTAMVASLVLAGCFLEGAPLGSLRTHTPTQPDVRSEFLRQRQGFMVIARVRWEEGSLPSDRRGNGVLGWRRSPTGQDVYFWTPDGQSTPQGRLVANGWQAWVSTADEQVHDASFPLVTVHAMTGLAIDPAQAMAWMLGVDALPDLAQQSHPVEKMTSIPRLDPEGRLAGFDRDNWRVRYQVWSPSGEVASNLLFPREWTLQNGEWKAHFKVEAIQLPEATPDWEDM